MKNKLKLKILLTLFFSNFILGKNPFSDLKKSIPSNLKKNWKKILSAHIVFSTFGAYRWRNKICENENCKKNKTICFLKGFVFNFFPFYIDIACKIEKEKLTNLLSNIFNLSPFLPLYLRQEIAFKITKESKVEKE